jgi:hypothetical protein
MAAGSEPLIIFVGQTRFDLALLDLDGLPRGVADIDRARLVAAQTIGGSPAIIDVTLDDGITLLNGILRVDLTQEQADALPVGVYVYDFNLHSDIDGWLPSGYQHMHIRQPLARPYDDA